MSRIGKKAVAVPAGVTATVSGQEVKMKGPKGELAFVLHDDVLAKLENGEIRVDPRNPTKRARAMWGMSRTMVANIAAGVTQGFEKKLEITGVGYRAALQGKNLQLALGFSQEVVYETPQGITIAVPKPTEITVSGIDKQQVGQVAAEIREYRPPEPYKGKGVKYAGEKIVRKEGKKKYQAAGRAAAGGAFAYRTWPHPFDEGKERISWAPGNPRSAAPSASAVRSRRCRATACACRSIARRRTSTRRSSTTRRVTPWPPLRASRRI
jgi:large subunit ribosomal protein L6